VVGFGSSRSLAKARVCVHAADHCRAAGGNDVSKRILVVEDQADNRQIIRDMLAPTDYEITGVESGEEALSYRKAAARSHTDGYPTTDYGRLHRYAPNQGRPRTAINQDYRGYVLCAQRRGEEGARGRL
jgi:hypothetical protein